MSDTHPSAQRSSRRSQLQTLVDRGATAGERAAARAALDKLEAEYGKVPTRTGFTAVDDILFDPKFDHRWAGLEHIRDETRAKITDYESIHDAEEHAAKIATFVVWRSDRDDADQFQCWGEVRLRLPNGRVMTARRCAGKIHDTEADRWGTLYRARDLRDVGESAE